MQLSEMIRNMSETDRRRASNERSNATQSGASVASQKLVDRKSRNLGCEVHLIPQMWEGEKLYTLSGSGECCQCKSNVDDWVTPLGGGPKERTFAYAQIIWPNLRG